MFGASVCFVIPTYNEVGTVRELIGSLEEMDGAGGISLVLVDGGSTDGTADAIEEMMRGHGNITLVRQGEKLGYGRAIADGFKAALSLGHPEYIVTLDADLSHDPHEVPRLVEACGRGVAVGSRYIEGGGACGLGLRRRMLSRAANLLARLVVGLPVGDGTSGFRCYRREVVEAVLPRLRSVGFEIQLEILLEVVRGGFDVREVPITFRGRRTGESKLGLRELLSFIAGIHSLSRRPRESSRA